MADADIDDMEAVSTYEEEGAEADDSSLAFAELYPLILEQLVHDGFGDVAADLGATLGIPPPSKAEASHPRLLHLVQMGNEADIRRAGTLSSGAGGAGGDGGANDDGPDITIPDEANPIPRGKPRPKFTTKFTSNHKGPVNVCAFSADGRVAATGSADSSIKILDVAKMRAYGDAGPGGGVRPVYRTLYDHTQAVNALVFHPFSPMLASGADDCTVKFFNYTQNTKRSFQALVDGYAVRALAFHPSGDYLVSGTDHPMLRLYDVSTTQCYISASKDNHHTGAITDVCYAKEGNVFASASVDGSVKIWDGVSNTCVNTIAAAHAGAEISSARFSNNMRYLLTSGLDATVRIWELTTGRLVRTLKGVSQHVRVRACWSGSEKYVLSADTTSRAVVAWDVNSGEVVGRLVGHANVTRYLQASPTEEVFFSCSDDHRGRFWVVE